MRRVHSIELPYTGINLPDLNKPGMTTAEKITALWEALYTMNDTLKRTLNAPNAGTTKKT